MRQKGATALAIVLFGTALCLLVWLPVMVWWRLAIIFAYCNAAVMVLLASTSGDGAEGQGRLIRAAALPLPGVAILAALAFAF